MTKRIVSTTLLCLLLTTGCTEQSHQQQLRQTMEALSSRPSGRIDPLPDAQDYPAIQYTGGEKRSPFRLHAYQAIGETSPSSDPFRPEADREKGELEQQPLSSLMLVGTLRFADAPAPTALIDDGQGEVHKVKTGEYLGLDFGRVVKITDDTVIIEETVQDEQGGWVKRVRQLSLAVKTDE